MGILAEPKNTKVATPSTAKRKTSHQIDYSSLGKLDKKGTTGFSSYRDKIRSTTTAGEDLDEDAMDSDDDTSARLRLRNDDDDSDKETKELLSPEDEAVAEGVRRIKV